MFTSAVVGQESSAWVHFYQIGPPHQPLYSNKRATIEACASCIVIKWQKDSVTEFVTPSNVAKAINICTILTVTYGRLVFLGGTTAGDYLCVEVNLQFVPL